MALVYCPDPKVFILSGYKFPSHTVVDYYMQQPGTAWIFCDCKIVCLASNGSEFFLCFSSRWIFQIHISKNCLQSSRMQSGLLSWLNTVFGRDALKNSITSGKAIKRFWQWPFKSPFWKKFTFGIRFPPILSPRIIRGLGLFLLRSIHLFGRWK